MKTIKIKNLLSIDNYRFDITCQNIFKNFVCEDIDGSSLVAFPAVIDPHVHFRTPGHEHKESWKFAAFPAILGGVTTVFDMPNNSPFISSISQLSMKHSLIENQLKEADIPLRYKLFLGATACNFHDIEMINYYKQICCGIKVFLGNSTGASFLSYSILDRIFRIAAELNLVVAVHAEDEEIIRKKQSCMGAKDWTQINAHSLSRPREAAIKAVDHVIELSHKHGTKVHILHVSTEEELKLIKEGKKTNKTIFAEAALPHLFFDEEDYISLGNCIKVNPPVRNKLDREALWEAINSGLIDTVGSDHAPHLIYEKQVSIEKAPSGIPGNPFLFPLILNAVNEGLLIKERVTKITHDVIVDLYDLEETQDFVLVDMKKEHKIEERDIKSLCKWSPFLGKSIKGWPMYVILKGTLYPGLGVYL